MPEPARPQPETHTAAPPSSVRSYADTRPSAKPPPAPTKETATAAKAPAAAHSCPACGATDKAAYAGTPRKPRAADRSPGWSPARIAAENTHRQAAENAPETPAEYHPPSTTLRPCLPRPSAAGSSSHLPAYIRNPVESQLAKPHPRAESLPVPEKCPLPASRT